MQCRARSTGRTTYTVENARLYTLPDQPPEIMVAASGLKAADLAGRVGDGLINTTPDQEIAQAFAEARRDGRPRFGKLTVCWAADEARARRTAYEYWPTAGLGGELSQELPMPAHFEQAAKSVTEEAVAEAIVCGPDPELHLAKIRTYLDAGYDHVYVHQVGPDQAGFFAFYERQVLPKLR